MLIFLRKPYSATSTSFHSFCLLVLSYLSATTHLHTASTATTAKSSFQLYLNVGLNLSIAYDLNNTGPYSLNLSIAGLTGARARSYFRNGVLSHGDGQLDDAHSIFLPILSSPGFQNSRSPSGFSFGFLASEVDSSGPIYLAMCGGLSGNLSDVHETKWISAVIVGQESSNYVHLTYDGYVVPLWIANGDSKPLTPGIILSLEVVRGAAPGDGNVLQLSDHTGATGKRVVWSVADAGMMEMQNTGNLVIYDTINKTKPVWQSFSQPRDTLFEGQKLTAGGMAELRSNDFVYSARMEKGGLVVYLNKVWFAHEQPAAYWVIPLSFPSMYSHPSSVLSRGDLRKQLLLELPCERSYMALGRSDRLFIRLDLEPGRCTEGNGNTWTRVIDATNVSFSPLPNVQFLRLENDGRLYWYFVYITVDLADQVTRVALDTDQVTRVAYFDWGDCAAPMACGPLGVCSSTSSVAPRLCSCPGSTLAEAATPDHHFEFINSTTPSKGCRLATPLPSCALGNEHIGTTSYLQVNETATLFLFGGWPFVDDDSIASVSHPRAVDKCMELCSANCSCTGFFYQAANSACFLMTDPIGLLRIRDQRSTRSGSARDGFTPSNGRILARNYITYLKVNPSPPPPRSVFRAIIEASVSAVVFLLILGSLLYLFHARKRKRKRDKARQAEDEELQDILPLLPTRFSYDDLKKATKGFSELLGAGGCGSVYAGVLLDGRKVAVKLLEAGLLKGQQSKQFLAEVATVGRTNHHNIVCLVGFCWEVNHRLLVYEYMEKGSLDQWLFAKGVVDVAKSTVPAVFMAPPLDWPTRYTVALGIARGLTYLHEECLQPILHFDIKPQNILLDDAYVAKLADFGLSKLMQRGTSEVVTGVRGTPGYIAPEMQAHGAVSKKSDVYSMGMVMLEIVGGRKNIDITLLTSASPEWHFPSWAAKKCEQGLMLELVDKRIGQAYDKEQACRLIQTAFWCIHDVPSKRPSASIVVQWLEGKGFITQPPFSDHTQSSVEEITSSM